MKYNTTYKQLISLKDSIKWIEKFRKTLDTHFSSLYSLSEVIPPVFLDEGNEMIVDFSNLTREVTLDLGDSYKVARILQSHTNWGRDLIHRIKLEENEGIKFFGTTIWRDSPESPVSTTVREELTYMFKVSKENEIKDVLKNLTKDLYQLIYVLLEQVKKEAKLDHQYPKQIKFVTAQQLENELPNLSFKEREIEALIEEEAYVFANPGKTLHSGKVHTFIPSELYDLNNFYQIVLKDRVNTDTIKVASVSVLASGELLKDQLALYDNAQQKAKTFYKDLMGREENIVEIKINLPRLAMALLAKGHIAEVQSGIISDESNSIKQRHKLEKY